MFFFLRRTWGRSRFCYTWVVYALCVMSSELSYGVVPSASSIVPSQSKFEQSIPIVVWTPVDTSPRVVRARIAFLSSTFDSDDEIRIDLDPNSDARARELMRSQIWVAAMASSIASQEPWTRVHWYLEDIPLTDGLPSAAPLALGLISTYSKSSYPNDTVILGTLFPDTSIGPVTQINKRLEAAKAAGIKRAVISNLQHFEISNGSLINIASFSKSLGIEPIFVNTLTEIVEKVLKKNFPSRVEMHSPSIPPAVNAFLDQVCRNELSQIQISEKSWPNNPRESSLLSSREKDLWDRVVKNYNAGLDAYRGGFLYVSYEKLRETNSLLQIVSYVQHVPKSVFEIQSFLTQAVALRKKISSLSNQSDLDQNELQSALVLAERNDWLFGLSSKIEGAQIFAQQAFSSRSQATPEDKDAALTGLIDSIQQVQFTLKGIDFYSNLSKIIPRQHRTAVQSRIHTWLPQLLPIYLAAGEFLPQGLQVFSNQSGEKLLRDSRLISQVQLLNDAKTEWDRQQKTKLREREPPIQMDTKLGFIPGTAYVKSSTSSTTHEGEAVSLSDTARILTWVNQYCEVVALENKYLGPESFSNSEQYVTKTETRALLQNMLQNAELGARSGIGLSDKAGIDSSILMLIYEKGFYLKENPDLDSRLEALREYWRCSLLGNICWQLAFKTSRVDPTITASLQRSSTEGRGDSTLTPVSQTAIPPQRSANSSESSEAVDLEHRVLPIPVSPQVDTNAAEIDLPPPSIPATPVRMDELQNGA
jgi:hypothetical protein